MNKEHVVDLYSAEEFVKDFITTGEDIIGSSVEFVFDEDNNIKRRAIEKTRQFYQAVAKYIEVKKLPIRASKRRQYVFLLKGRSDNALQDNT